MTQKQLLIQIWNDHREIVTELRKEQQQVINEYQSLLKVILPEMEINDEIMSKKDQRKILLQKAIFRIMKYMQELLYAFKNSVIQNNNEKKITDEITLEHPIYKYLAPKDEDLIDMEIHYQESIRNSRLKTTREILQKCNLQKDNREDFLALRTKTYCRKFKAALEGKTRSYLITILPFNMEETEENLNWEYNYLLLQLRQQEVQKLRNNYEKLKEQNDQLIQQNQQLQNIINTAGIGQIIQHKNSEIESLKETIQILQNNVFHRQFCGCEY